VTQVAEGVGTARPGVALPIRVHDLLLGLAGRLDDDALADARELLASAELDRSLEFIVGCLAAGRIAVTHAQRRELETLFTQVYLDPAVLGRLVVDDAAAVVRHRFGGGVLDGKQAGHGVADAAQRVLEVLPDIRSVWAVWRLTPAGAVSGPVPHRVVLVGVGPDGFPPATAYRLEHALRRADIHASVEVLRDGIDAPDYHHAAMQYASQVPVGRPASRSPVMSSRPSSGGGEPKLFTPAAEPRVPTPPAAPQLSAPSVPVAPAPPTAPAPPVAPVAPAAPAAEPRMSAPGPAAEPPRPPAPPASDPLAHAVQHLANPPSGRRSRVDPPADPPAAQPEPPEPKPSDTAQIARQAGFEPPAENGSGQAARPAEAMPAPLPVDDSLSEQERDLLRQLQEELARREQEESAASRQDDVRGRHGGPPSSVNPFDWPTTSNHPTVINGVPPQNPDQRR
jgi:hypothetical protein